MAPLSLKIVLDEGAVTRTLKFESTATVAAAQAQVKEKILTGDDGKVYGLFLTSADDERSGIWLEGHRQLDYYMLRDGDQLHYLCRMRNLRVRLLDGSVRTLQVDESKTVEELMADICARLGITNHDEYGLCHDRDESDENKPPAGTGTLTLKRNPQKKERDAKLEQLSKKIKTDDNVEWLEQKSTLRELGAGDKPLLLKRRLFYSDRKVDARDPVQLNLLYVQARDAILEGRHPVTEDQAVEFAGIQCQVHYGDFQEDKHKPGLIENLNEYLPEQYSGSWGVEKKILKEHRKHQGLSPIDAKYLYTKTARDLPTYGVTFFLVKEKQKGKKKLVPRLLGINAESILRLDEVTKEILQVWPLTQVKTYHAGKAETFTLNFGDYSDKEYSVKTNDAHRIRDILQGYIDLIRRRLEAKWHAESTESHVTEEEYVGASRAQVMEHVQHNSKALVEETFVGPSKIISYEPGQQISQGTQIMTVQQIVVTGKGSNHQNVLVGEVPMRKDMSLDFVRKLNRLNSNSVKVVAYLTQPSDGKIEEARHLIQTMAGDMPSIEKGVHESAAQQPTEDAKKKLLNELKELSDAMKSLSEAIFGSNVKLEEGEEAAKRIADLSTQMYFSLDPRTIKRGDLCRRSRNSFIQDDKMDATLRRASVMAAAQVACANIDKSKAGLEQSYEGPILDASAVKEVEKAAQDKMGKLNAAVALYLMAYSDPKNVDYSAAVTSMNTINELLPELTKDAMMLSGVKDDKSRQELLDQIRDLCDAAKRICLITDPDDHEKIQSAANDYGRVSEKLLFTFRRGGKQTQPNDIVELAKDVGRKTSQLVSKAVELSSAVPPGAAGETLGAAGKKCADAAKDLVTCATVTAPSIHEPHCQSALTAAAETLSSSAQHLAATWKPLVEDPSRKQIGEDLKDHTLDLAKALDRLKAAFASLNGSANEGTDDERIKRENRLKFITTLGGAKNRVKEAEDELMKALTSGAPLDKSSADELQKKLAQRVAQLNAALAALVAASSDRNNPDYATADLAVATITELMPEIVKDGKALSATQDEQSQADLLRDLKALCDATKMICEASENGSVEALNNSASGLARTSGKLFYVFNPRANQDKEHEIIDLSSAACERASQMLASVYQLAADVGGDAGTELDQAGSKVADAANALLTSAQLTSPCMEDPRCQASLLSSANALSSVAQQLASTWAPAVQDPRFIDLKKKLEGDRQEMEKELERLRKACQVAASDGYPEDRKSGIEEKHRLQFVTTAAAAKKQVDAAEKELNKPVVAPKGRASSEELKQKLYGGVAQLNAAAAALVAAAADREKPDFIAADNAMNTINQLLPQIVKDTKTVSSGEDEKTRAEMLSELRALCGAARGLCDSAGSASNEDLNNSAAKFATASGKLTFVFNPRADQNKEHEILDLSSSSCEKASRLLNAVYQLAAAAEGEAGSQLDIAGSKVADAANALLTTAQLTAPCIQDPRCQASLLSSTNALSSANQRLATVWMPLIKDSQFEDIGAEIQKGRTDLDEELERLKNACRLADSGNVMQVKSGRTAPAVPDKRRLQFAESAAAADHVLQQAEKELTKPIVALKSGQTPADLQSKLADSLARLNAAIAAFLQATADRDKPDYEVAEQSIQAINQLMPQVVKDTKALSASKDEKDRKAMLDDLKAMCESARGVCASLRDGNHENLNYNAVKFGTNSGKLFYVISPRTNQTKEHQIMDLSSQACEKATVLLTEVYALAAEVGGEAGAELDNQGSTTADAAKTLLATAQLTAPSIHEPQCRASMLSAANALSSSAGQLALTWARHGDGHSQAKKGAALDKGWKDLEDAVEKIRATLNEDALKSPTKRAPPPPPKRSVSNEHRLSQRRSRDINQEFLDTLRCEESQNASNTMSSDAVEAKNKRKTDDEKALQQLLARNIDAGALRIKKAEDDVTRLYSARDEVIPALSVDQTLVVQKQMEQKLALAGVAASNLVASSHPDSIDSEVASKSTTVLADLMPHIVQDAKLLRGSLNEEERKRFLADILALFEATKNMLESAKEDRKKLDLSAVEFGNKSAKLLYVVSTDVDPSQEKEVLERVRNINESASRLAVLGADSASALDAEQMQALCQAGGKCAEAATTLAYTAKLVAPSIQNPECNEALTKASNDLSTKLQSYSSTWKPLEASSQITELKTEAASLEKLLEELRRDLGTGKLVKRRTVERVVVEDTPLRRLACVVQEEAKKRAESTLMSPEQRVKYAKYANELGQAIKQLDLAYHRCRKSPHDPEKRQDLEYAVQNLQITLLQTRPSQDGRPQNNIVDLTEYVKEVGNDAAQLRKECKNGQPEIQSVLDTIKQHCEQMSSRAQHLTTAEQSEMADEVGWMEIEQFAEECDNHLKGINYMIEGLNDGKLKIDLQEKTTRLSEDCNMLRFATKCALASSQGVSLDATLDDLTDLEARIDEMLAQGEKSKNKPTWSTYGRGRVVSGVSRACAGAASELPPAYTAYMDDVRSHTDLGDETDRNRNKEHLRKVLGLLKALTMTTSRHVATWQKLGHPETAEITAQILQELDSHQNQLQATKGKAQTSVLSEVDMNKLLFPPDIKVQGDHKQIADKLQQAASKLSTTASTIMQSAHKPEALSRSAHAALDAAVSVAAHARALRTNDLAQSQKMDEATKEISLQTYNVLNTADSVSQEPNNIATRRKLLDACRRLNDAINQLVRTTSPSNKLQRECGELTRSLQLQQGLLQSAAQPSCSMHYAASVEALRGQSDVIQKLSNDEPMSRTEFSRTLSYVSSAVCNSTEYAAQCAYLLSIADQHKEIATAGFIDTSRIKSLSEAVQDTCHRIIRTDVEQAKAEEVVLNKQIQDLQQAVTEARDWTQNDTLKKELNAAGDNVDSAAKALYAVVKEKKPDRARLTTFTIRLLDSVKSVDGAVEGASLAPEVTNVSPEAKARSDDVLKNSRALNNNLIALLREVKASDDLDPMTWVTFGASRKAVLDMFEALVNSVKENGKRAGVLPPSESDLEEDADQPKRSYVQIQLDLANKWLRRSTAKADVKSAGEDSARNIIHLGEQMAEDLKDNEKEEMLQLTQESKALLTDCLVKYESDKASALMERLKELRKNIERGVVTRVVEDFLEGEAPLADLDILAEVEKDETKRKFLLERKIAELLAHLGRVTKTARIVAGAGSGGPQLSDDLIKCSNQTELLAPMLVKAAQQRVTSPDDKAAIEHYQKLLAQYAESLANVRNLCDQAVDPMDFVQTAGETMQRMREDTHDNDPQKCAYASTAITKLANRVINVSLSSNDVRKDPELQKLLKEAREKLKATVPPPNARPSRIPDFKTTTAEILRTTGEVESVLGGEMIFNKQQGTDQPIFAAARDLHTAVREWSARDNDIVAVAKRMAVLMAKLSGYMHTDRKRELLATSKAIVTESHEVAELARKLAHECTDVRIKTNLLQCCERIPTISGQLKMLATVKGSSLGHQGLKEDQEDMIMLVGNAQNLMLSVQEVVKAAAGASVKIASQRGGPRMRWVRKNYY